MKINDVVVEAPMGLLKRAGLGIKKMVPGAAGQKAQGQLDTGRVANSWKKQYSIYLGRINQEPSTENLAAFLKQLGLNDDLIKSTVSEEVVIERALTRADVDKLILSAAQKAAGAPSADTASSSSTAASGTGTASPAAADSSDAPATATPAAKPGLLSRAASAVKKAVSGGAKPAARVEPTVVTPSGPATAAAPAKNLDTYVNNWAKSINAAKSSAEKVALAKEMINFLKDRQGSSEASRAAAMAKATLKRQPDPTVRKIAQSSAFAMERKIYSIANRLLEAVGLTWKDLGYRILVTESTADYIVIGER